MYERLNSCAGLIFDDDVDDDDDDVDDDRHHDDAAKEEGSLVDCLWDPCQSSA